MLCALQCHAFVDIYSITKHALQCHAFVDIYSITKHALHNTVHVL